MKQSDTSSQARMIDRNLALSIEPNADAHEVVAAALTGAQLQSVRANALSSAWDHFSRSRPGVVVMAAVFPGRSTAMAIGAMLGLSPTTKIAAMVESGDWSMAIDCLRAGARHVAFKPLTDEAAKDVVSVLEGDPRIPRRKPARKFGVNENGARLKATYPLDFLSSKAGRDALRSCETLSSVEIPMLIHAGPGGLSELFARRAHETRAKKANAPFVPFHCEAASRGFVERLLAPEGGVDTLYHAAAGGTLYLEAVGALSEAAQRYLAEWLRRPTENTRLIVSEPRGPEWLRDASRFDPKLYRQLNVAPLATPPLRDRMEDVGELAKYFLHEAKLSMGRELAWEESGLEALRRHRWPENERELRETVFAMARDTREGALDKSAIPERLRAANQLRENASASPTRKPNPDKARTNMPKAANHFSKMRTSKLNLAPRQEAGPTRSVEPAATGEPSDPRIPARRESHVRIGNPLKQTDRPDATAPTIDAPPPRAGGSGFAPTAPRLGQDRVVGRGSGQSSTETDSPRRSSKIPTPRSTAPPDSASPNVTAPLATPTSGANDGGAAPSEGASELMSLAEAEWRHMLNVYVACGRDPLKAAEVLGVSIEHLADKLGARGIQIEI